MARPRNAPDDLRRPRRIYLSPREVQTLAPHLGSRDFSEWARARLLSSLQGDLPAAREVSAGRDEIAPPAPKETITLPPPGEPDADGCRYRWEPGPKGDSGTLRIVLPDGRALEMDLIGVEVEPLTGGGRRLHFADRSMIRDGVEDES
jgi:hypothetical protein